MANKDGGFTAWLCEYLNDLGLDGDVYGDYIASSLQELKEATEEERMEAVYEFVSGALGDEGEGGVVTCRTIVKEWEVSNPKSEKQKKPKKKPITIQAQVDKVIKTTACSSSSADSASLTTPTGSSRHAPSMSDSMKRMMLSQYGYTSDDDIEENHSSSSTKGKESGSSFGQANTNKSIIDRIEREKREALKQLHVEKLEREKLGRDNQKQKKEDRKEREKQRTQKQERRR